MSRAFLCTAASVIALVPGLASAQTEDPASTSAQVRAQTGGNVSPGATDAGPAPDIVVTATRRNESLQLVPIAVTALGNQDIQNKRIVSVDDLTRTVPNLTVGLTGVTPQVFIRGVGFEQLVLGGDPGVSYNVDGVYLGRPSSAAGNYFDIDRIEVLRGPQGTLWGRNSTGGAINVISNKPTSDLGFLLSGEVSNYGGLRTEGMANIPLSDGVKTRFAFTTNNHDGYTLNLVNNRRLDDADTFSARGQVLFDLGARSSLRLEADYSRDTGTGPVYKVAQYPAAYAGFGVLPVPTDIRQVRQDLQSDVDNKFYGFTGELNIGFDFGTLTALSSYQNGKTFLVVDGDVTEKPLQTLFTTDNSEQFSQEVRLASNGDGRFGWLIGGYYFNEKNVRSTRLSIFELPGTADGRVKTDAYAVFGEVNYRLADGLKAIGGLRYSHDHKNGFGNLILPGFGINTSAGPTGNWGDVTWKAGLEYQATPTNFLYGTVSTGFKSGGFNINGSIGPNFAPEKVTNYEVGSKNSFFGRRATLNLAAFYDTYTDLQISQLGTIVGSQTNNGSLEIYGAELEATVRPVSRFQIDGSLGYLHTRFTQLSLIDPTNTAAGQQNLRGRRQSRSPEWKGNIGASYELPTPIGSFTLRGDYSFQGPTFYRPFNLPADRVGRQETVNARLIWNANQFVRLEAYVQNLQNNDNVTNIQVGFSNARYLTLAPPRLYGVRLTLRH